MPQILKSAVSLLYRWIAAPVGLFTLAVVVILEYQVYVDSVFYREAYQKHNTLMEIGVQRTFADIEKAFREDGRFCITWTEENEANAIVELSSVYTLIGAATQARASEVARIFSDLALIVEYDQVIAENNSLAETIQLVIIITEPSIGVESCMTLEEFQDAV